MHMAARTQPPSNNDAILVQALGPRIILTTFLGRSNRAMSEAAAKRFQNLIASMERPIWVSDASQLTGFDPSTLTLGARWFSAFKERGSRDCLVVSEWDVAMMAARTMALGIGVRVRNFSTLDEAKASAMKFLEAA